MEFSIIYTTYRPGGFDILADSLRNQTMKNYELIIIDDYTIDRRNLIKSYLDGQGIPVTYIGPCKPKCFPEIAYNQGNAINTGFLLSTKEIVILLQDYQWLPPDCLEKFAKRHTLFKDNYCIVLPGQMWNDTRPKNNEGLISIWSQPWKGRPEENGCQEAMVSVYSGRPSPLWIPEAWEYSCIAWPWNVISEANGWPECLDSYVRIPTEPLRRRFEAAGGKSYVDKDNFMEMVNHRVWLPHELWGAGHMARAGSTEFIERENCFDLKTHIRGRAYWLEENVFLRAKIPEVTIHRIQWIQSKVTLQDKVLDVGCAENPVWAGTPFKVTTLDKSVRPEEQCFPNVIGEAENLPFEDKSFDIVAEGELLEHVPNPQQVLKEAVRVARKKVIITVPWEHVWPPELKPFWNPGHVRFYSKETFRDELKQLELPFNIEEIRHGPWAWLGAEVFCEETTVATNEMVKINLGSFRDTIGYGWENWDILPIQQYITPGHKFKQWDVRRGLPLADGSVDLIRMSHLIEHLTLEEAHRLCGELYRALKPGGLARISTPDAKIIIRHYQSRDMSFFNQIQPPEYIQAPTEGEKLSRLLFSDPAEHKAIYNFEMVKNFLEQAGFERIYNVSPGFSHSATMRNETEDQHIEISLTVEAVK